MKTLTFSSWNGKTVDNRKGTAKAAPLAGIPLDLDGKPFSALMGWNGLIVVDPQTDVVSLTLAYLAEARKLSCGECSICMIGIDRALEIVTAMSGGKGTAADLAEIETIAKGVAANGKCNYGRASLAPLLDAVKAYRSAFLEGKTNGAGGYASAVSAPCMKACPATLDIPGYIELIRNGKFTDSLNLIRQRCILPGVIGRSCTHPCEAACIRNNLDAPVAIRLLKRAAADEDLKDCSSALAAPKDSKKEKIAVIGAGPAGLAAAYHLRRLGYGVTIFEALPKAGGMAAVGIPDYRLPKDVLNHEIDLIKRTGVEIRLNTPVDALDAAKMAKEGFAAIFLAVGAHAGTAMGCAGEDKADGVLQGADFLRELALGKKAEGGGKVVVVGGGNVALDCARNCVRLGYKPVEIVYRRTRAEMPASKEEIEEALQEGVKFTYLAAPAGIVRNKTGKVTAMTCTKMKLGEPDKSGRRRPVPIKGSEFDIKADRIIAAVGQKPNLAFLGGKDAKALISDWGTVKADGSGKTAAARIFAGGDCVLGPATLIEALDMGNKAAAAIDAALQGASYEAELSFDGVDVAAQRAKGFIPQAAAMPVPLLDPAVRSKGYDEVEGGLCSADAVKEAQRCLRCYRLMVWK